MFESANLAELATMAQSVITAEVVSTSKTWKLDEHLRQKIRHAMFGPGKPSFSTAKVAAADQREMLSQFTKMVAGPIIELLPPDTAAFVVLILYEEFINAVFIQPVLEADVGGGS